MENAKIKRKDIWRILEEKHSNKQIRIDLDKTKQTNTPTEEQ